MTARGGTVVLLGFALVWLWVGTSGLAMPWRALVGGVGLVVLAVTAWRALRGSDTLGRTRNFRGGRFAIAVIAEVVAAVIAGQLLGQNGLLGYIWPTVGIIVGLHFIGLWWATDDRRYLALTAVMTAINVVALAFPPGGAAMLAVSGLGSCASLAWAVGWRR